MAIALIGALCAGVVAPAAQGAPAQAQGGSNRVVFYSGFGIAGIDFASPIATHEFVHTRDSDTWESWSASTTCASHKADDFPNGSADVLVGWSIGRMAPIHFLAQSRNRWSEIDTIWLLDPGTEEKMTGSPEDGNCDGELAQLPSQYLREWMLEDSSRRLIILSGDLTEEDDRAGLERFYLSRLDTTTLYAQTHLCGITPGEVSNHDNRLVQFFMPFTTGPAECPDRTTRLLLPDQPAPAGSGIAQSIAESQWSGATGRDGAVVRLYGSVFSRLPDESGFAFWVADGRTTFDMARFFVTSDEFVARYGTLTDDQFIEAIYRNVLNRSPDDAGLAYWRERMNAGLSRADLVVFFSDGPEFRQLSFTA